MLKKVITYKDYNDKEITEELYFNINKAEAMEMELSAEGGLGEQLQRIIDTQDAGTIVKEFKSFVLKAYGEKTPDGKYFKKNDDIRAKFEASAAYPIIFMELATNAEAAAAFVNGVLPKEEPNTGVMPK